MSYTLNDLQQMTNNQLFGLVLQTGVKKVAAFPINWTESQRNVVIIRLNRFYNPPQEAQEDVVKPVVNSATNLTAIVENLQLKSPNNPLLSKNVNTWSVKDLEKAKTFL